MASLCALASRERIWQPEDFWGGGYLSWKTSAGVEFVHVGDLNAAAENKSANPTRY